MFEAEMAAYPPVPPLAVNSRLTAAALVHSGDMLNNAFQGHTGTDGSSAGDRITKLGYKWARWSENVYAYAESPLHSHAGFVIRLGPRDWRNAGSSIAP